MVEQKKMQPMQILHVLYKWCISPFLGNNCRFHPTCSDYCRDAINEHGICKGLVLSIGRVLRCQPIFEGGFDPVPQKRKV